VTHWETHRITASSTAGHAIVEVIFDELDRPTTIERIIRFLKGARS
jgi:hypothetical protein